MKMFGPKDIWPRHGNDRWNELLNDARSRGWSFEKFTSHRFGALHCPADECYFPKIDSSAEGTETFAKSQHKKIVRCPHSVQDQEQTVAEVRDRLDRADRYSDAADGLMASEGRRAEAEELLLLAEENVPTADDIDQAFDLALFWGEEGARQAAGLLEETPLSGEERPATVLDAASEEVADATGALTKLPGVNTSKEALVDRAEALKDRIEGQKVQVEADRADTR